MNFWLIQPLATKLAAEQVNDKQGMYYFLASTLLILLQTQYAMWWGPRSGWLFWFELVILAVITLVGCIKCWEINNDREFVFRAICLSVPSGIRVFVLSMIFGWVFAFVAPNMLDYQNFRNPERAYNILSYAGFVGFSIYFWYLLYNGMNTITKIQGNHASAT